MSEMDGNLQEQDNSQSNELDELRCRLREIKANHREKQRESLMKKKRFMDDVQLVDNVSTEELMKLAKKLKIKSQVTCEMLQTIMNNLLSSKENIEAFLSVDGALQALLRNLSGYNEKFQLLAARCICNLALGNEKSSLKVLKASDSYLFAHLAGKNKYVKEACAIALGNFSCIGPKAIELLLLQGFFPKITNLLQVEDEMLEEPLIYALTQLVYHGFDVLSEEHLREALRSIVPIFQKKSFLVVFIVSVLSAHISCHEIIESEGVHTDALKHLLISLGEGEDDAVFYLRIVSNCIWGEMAASLLNESHGDTLREAVRMCLQSEKEHLRKECLGLIGNVLNHSNESIAHFGSGLINDNFQLVQSHVLRATGSVNELTSTCANLSLPAE